MLRNFVLCLTLLIAVNAAAGENGFSLTFEPQIYRSFGNTEFELFLSEPIEGTPITYSARSELKFPLDAFMVGFQARLDSRSSDSHPWSLRAAIHTNIGDPSGKMYDTDWEILTFYYNTMWSYTESDATMRSGILDLEGSICVIKKPKTMISVIGGVRYHHIHQDIINFEGWQLERYIDQIGFGDTIYVAFDDKGIIYEIDYWMPKLGLEICTDVEKSLAVEGRLFYTYFHFSDYDDHLLRRKISEGDGNGSGVLGELDFKYLMPSSTPKWLPYIALSARISYLKSNGTQSQRWLNDEGFEDPDTGEWIGVRAGDVIPGIPHEVSMLSGSVALKVGIRF